MKRDLDLDRETNSEGSCWFGTSSENVERAAMASSTGTAITNSSGKLEGEKQSLTHRTKKKDQLLQTIASFLSQNLHSVSVGRVFNCKAEQVGRYNATSVWTKMPSLLCYIFPSATVRVS